MATRLKGSCLCGSVTFSVGATFEGFYLCHCAQCQKVTGSAFAPNIISATDNIEWHSGLALVTTFHHPSRAFSKAFCTKCGSGVPHLNKAGTTLVIPAGSLDDAPKIQPTANLFTPESPAWLQQGLSAKRYKRYPDVD